MKQVLALVATVAAVIIGSKLLIENMMGIRLEPLVSEWAAHAGAGTAAMVIGLLAADLVLPIPSSLIMVASGAAFGVVWGSLISLVGSVGGEWLGFELVRRYGRAVSARLVGEEELGRLSRMFDRHGAAAVAFTRPLPVVMETMSVVAGLSSMTRRTFLAASVAGTAPVVIVYAYAGAVSRAAGSVVPALVILIAVAGLGWVIYRARLAQLELPSEADHMLPVHPIDGRHD